MDSGSARNGNGTGSGDQYHRHTAYQIQQLEQFFKQCSHPDGAQQEQLSADLVLTPKQVKFWFQNRRTQAKAQHEKSENHALKVEIQKLKRELLELKVGQEKSKCPKYVDSSIGKSWQQTKNVKEKPEHERPLLPPSEGLKLGVSSQGEPALPFGSREICSSGGPFRCLTVPSGLSCSTELNKRRLNNREVIELAISAMDELKMLLESWDPFWVKFPVDGRLVIDDEIYKKSFPTLDRSEKFTRIESSKDSRVVSMHATGLVDMFMDPDKWLDLFPTIVAKSRKLEVISIDGANAGTLQLMHAKLHKLSPLVAPREFYFLRYGKEIKPGRWVIVDVSCDYSSHCASSLMSWRRPSGCLIQDKFNGSSEITWVEHVEVDSRFKINDGSSDVLSGCGAYGAERWLFTLQWTVERIQCSTGANYHLLHHRKHGAIQSDEMRRSLMDLSHKMVKKFVAMASLSTDSMIAQQLHNEIHASVSWSDESGQASGTVLGVSSSVWLPVPCTTLFNFLRDEKIRAQWDMFNTGHLEEEFAHISCGTHPGNRISLIRTSDPGMFLLQESRIHHLDSIIVYAPIASSILTEAAMRRQVSENISIFPAGFIISGYEKENIEGGSMGTSDASNGKRGSILTVAIQVKTLLPMEKLPFKTVEETSTLTRSIVDKIKVAVCCQ